MQGFTTDFAAAAAVRLTGRVDSATAGTVRDRLHAAARSGRGMLVVDMSNVDILDATGLGVLMGTHRLAESLGRRMALRGTPPRMVRLLHVTRLDRYLPTLPAVEGSSAA